MKRIPLFVFVLLLVTSSAFLHWRRHELVDSFSLARAVSFNQASLAIYEKGDRHHPSSYYVVFDSNKRLAQVDEGGGLLRLLESNGSPNAGFYLANNIAAADDGTIYIASTYINPDTLIVNRECIVRYDRGGAYGGVLFSCEHDEAALVDNMGLIRALQVTPDGIQFCRLTGDSILTYQVSRDGNVLQSVPTRFENASTAVQSVALSENGSNLAFTTAAAVIYACAVGDVPKPIFDGRTVGDDVFSIPGDVCYFGSDLYFSDLGRDGIAQVQSGNQSRMVFDARLAAAAGYTDHFYECKNFSVISMDRFVFNNNNKIIDFQGVAQTCRVLQQAQWGPSIWGVRALYWLVLLTAVLSVVLLLHRIVQNADIAGRQMFKQMLLVLCMVAVATGMAVSMVFNNMSGRLNELSKNGLRGYLELGRLLVDAQAVERVNHVRDYMNDDYRNLLTQLQQTITREGDLQAGVYSGIYKVFGNKVTALAYHDGLRGIFYPYNYDFKASIYAPVQDKGGEYLGEIADQYGVWQIGVAPILNKQGACVGLLEVGIDMSARQEANRKLLTHTVISISMILFVLVFIFLEIGFLNSHVFDNSAVVDADAMQRYDEGVLRFASYIAISGVFLSVSFLPLFSKSLAHPIGCLPFDIVIGLPMVIETLCGAVIAVAYGHVRHRLGLKLDMVLACVTIAVGMVVTSQAPSYVWLTGGRMIVGMGMGLLMIAFRTYFMIESNSVYRESGIVALTAGVVAGINTGSVSGGMLAARLGMRSVFLLQAALLLLSAIFILFMLRNRQRPPILRGEHAISTRAFMFTPKIWGFFLFAFLPVTACGMFLSFFFPLFAQSQGCTEDEISRAFMLFGLCGVYLGPSLTKITTNAFGAGRSVFVGALLMTGGLLLFAYSQTLTVAYITVMLFGLTDSFIFNQGLNYLTSLKAVARFGEDKAMGVYNVFESGGEAIGPIVFGLAMTFSMATGVGIIASILALSSSLFLLICKPRKEPSC